jgi:UDP-N-acetylmuramoylalanine--D-glutamate ligase
MIAQPLHHIIGKNVAILGMAKSGQSAWRLLQHFPEEFTTLKAFDDANPNFEPLTRETVESSSFDTLIVSPGVPLSKVKAMLPNDSKVKLISEIDLASYFLTDEIVIGITGSVGKSTTTSLLGHALKILDPNAFIGGNLGTPLCEYAIHLLNKKPKSKFVALELSSYQIENLHNLRLHVGAITSLVPNHLERYQNKHHYYDTKISLSKMTQGSLILNKNGGELWDYVQKTHSLSNVIWTDPSCHLDFDFRSMKLLGEYNHDNAAVVLSILKYLKSDPACFKAIQDFTGLPHRLELVADYKQIRYINDSKATAIQSVMESIQAILPLTQNRIHLLLGGRDKKLDWERLGYLKSYPQIKCYFFGESGSLIKEKTGLEGPIFPSLMMCLDHLASVPSSGDSVLLSPGGTSLDEFRSFEHRGEEFKKWVKSQLK